MSTLTAQPMSLVSVEFEELYARHLCRHSQFGINLIHLIALFGVWFGVYGFVYSLTREAWVPIALACAYFVVLLPYLPLRVSAAMVVFLAVFVAAVLWVPPLPVVGLPGDDPGVLQDPGMEPQVVHGRAGHDRVQQEVH